MKPQRSSSPQRPAADLATLDQLTGGAFTAPTTSERAARVREWLATDPAQDLMHEVYRELSNRDKGAARPLKDKLDEIKRARLQEGLVSEWAAKAHTLLEQPRLNVADAMAWQRDAAKAGAPLSREPLAALKQQLTERIKAVDDLQHRIQVAREAAVLLAQRIEVLSTKPLADARQANTGLNQDVQQWLGQADALVQDPQWGSIEPRFVTQLEAARTQLTLVWDAFEAALTQAVAALADGAAPLPAVPVWADEIRLARGETLPQPAAPALDPEAVAAARAKAREAVEAAVQALSQALEQGQSKAIHRVSQELRQVLKEQHRWLTPEVEGPAQALLAQAGDMEGWQRWRADQLRQELVERAEALTAAPEGQRLGGRKMQEALRGLRESWKQIDQGGVPNHALWKRFDEACTRAHKQVEEWLAKVRQEAAEHRAQRLALIQELNDWAAAHADNADWRLHARELHRLSEAWRHAGHLSEKQFAELQPLWKAAMDKARAPLEAAQAANLAQRQALIAQAQALGAAPQLKLDDIRALQQQWQQLAQAVPLDRRQEQKLWEAFRQPIDQAFARKDAARAQQAQSLSALDQRVMDAARALQEAIQSQDAQRIQAAMAALEQASRGDAEASVNQNPEQKSEQKSDQPLADQANTAIESGATQPNQPARKLVAVRGDDRPGMKRPEPAPAARAGGRSGRDERGGPGRREGAHPAERRGERAGAASGPRLGDAAFRARREALEQAQLALKKLAAQAHGQSLTQLLDAWKARDSQALPSAQGLGGRISPSIRQAWAQALGAAAGATAETAAQATAQAAAPTAAQAAIQAAADEALLRLEIAAEVPTPASHLDARRALQLKLLTRRNDPTPAQTWAQDVATVLAADWSPEAARRLQQALKLLLRHP